MPRRRTASLAPIVVLAACAQRGALPANPVATLPALHAHAAPSVRAWGTLVDDPHGYPLPNVPVKLMPWQPCKIVMRNGKPLKPERRICPAPVARTTTGPKGFFSVTARPGHYLLVIGTDSPALPPANARPTIHDNAWLQPTPAAQHLLAPGACTTWPQAHCLPPFYGYQPPKVELTHDYRLAELNTPYARSVEVPCLADFDAQRELRGLAPMVEDEWLVESNHGVLWDYTMEPSGHAWHGFTGGLGVIQGGSSCADLASWLFTQPTQPWQGNGSWYAVQPQTVWFGGGFSLYNAHPPHVHSSFGSLLYAFDARYDLHDPNVPVPWP